jgi:hypothetical protein
MSTTTEENMSCPICYDTIDTVEVNYMSTSCGHKFHSMCILNNVFRNGFSCPYCRQNMRFEEGGEDDLQQQLREEIDEIRENVDNTSSDPDDSESDADPIMDVIELEHTAAREVGLPSPYDFCVELQSRYDVHMIDLMRIILAGDVTLNAIIPLHYTRHYEETIISPETSGIAFERISESMLHLISEYRGEREEEYRREWMEDRQRAHNTF